MNRENEGWAILGVDIPGGQIKVVVSWSVWLSTARPPLTRLSDYPEHESGHVRGDQVLIETNGSDHGEHLCRRE
jgi:hypothetical protein